MALSRTQRSESAIKGGRDEFWSIFYEEDTLEKDLNRFSMRGELFAGKAKRKKGNSTSPLFHSLLRRANINFASKTVIFTFCCLFVCRFLGGFLFQGEKGFSFTYLRSRRVIGPISFCADETISSRLFPVALPQPHLACQGTHEKIS